MSVENSPDQGDAKLAQSLQKFASNEVGRNLVRLGATVAILTGGVSAINKDSSDDLLGLTSSLVGLGLVLYTGYESTREIDGLVEKARSESENSLGEQS